MEIRKDYILDKYVIISESRGNRPNDFKDIEPADDDSASKMCYFCPGNESLTPQEKGHLGEPWKIRWFENKFHALAPEGKFDIKTDNNYFTYSDSYGYHEVIVENNSHKKQLFDLNQDELKNVFDVYKNRIRDLSAKEHIKYVLIFKNHGKNAGTSIKHSHTQVAALNHIPSAVVEKIDAVKRFDHCPYCDIINIEKESYRRCFETESFVAFAPYASRFNYEIWIFPKSHYPSITQLDDLEVHNLAKIMRMIMNSLKILNVSYNMFIHNTPEFMINYSRGLHFHIIIAPRISTFGGFEFGSDDIINVVSPEMAAKFYRGEQ